MMFVTAKKEVKAVGECNAPLLTQGGLWFL